jgi:hypothetical protein
MAQAIIARIKPSINTPLGAGKRGGTAGRGRERGELTEAAVVLTVTVTLVAQLPKVAGFGETVQLASAGSPVHVKVTIPAIPPWPPILKVYVADRPGETVAEVEAPEGGANEKSSPVPFKATLCGLPTALSDMLSAPVRLPDALGWKVTEIMHFAPALTLPAHVFVWEKSPVAVIPEMVNEELPVLLRLSVCAAPLIPDNWAGKVSDAVDRLTKGPSPVPFSATLCGLPVQASWAELALSRFGLPKMGVGQGAERRSTLLWAASARSFWLW